MVLSRAANTVLTVFGSSAVCSAKCEANEALVKLSFMGLTVADADLAVPLVVAADFLVAFLATAVFAAFFAVAMNESKK